MSEAVYGLVALDRVFYVLKRLVKLLQTSTTKFDLYGLRILVEDTGFTGRVERQRLPERDCRGSREYMGGYMYV